MPENAERLLVDAWGNPPGSKTLGMILAADSSPLSASGWGVIITYSEDGFVKDDDADKINYEELLADMKEQNKADSDERVKQGYSPMLLVGWAETPAMISRRASSTGRSNIPPKNRVRIR